MTRPAQSPYPATAMKRAVRAVVPAVLVIFAGGAGWAGCGPRAAVIDQLERHHGEVRLAMGLAASGRLFEVFASASGSWTIVATAPDGVTCGIASGERFVAVPLPVPGVPG